MRIFPLEDYFMDNTDWKAALSSEIFREYVQNELIKEASQPSPEQQLEEGMRAFQELQSHVNANPKLKKAFLALQKKFATDAAYRQATHPHFANGVMMLDLSEDQE